MMVKHRDRITLQFIFTYLFILSIILPIVFTQTVAANTLRMRSAVLHLSFDEVVNNITYDYALNNNATVYNASLVAGKYGNALSFDGVDDYVDAGDSDSLTLVSSFTIEAWVYPLSNNALMSVVDKGGTNGNREYRIRLFDNNGVVDPNHIQILIGDSSGAWGLIWYPQVNISINKWTHLVVRWDGNIVELYINGEKVTNTTYTGTTANGANSVLIGANRDNSDNIAYFFNGTIDEVKIYNRALSSEEIYADYVNGCAAINASIALNYTRAVDSQDNGSVLYLKFDENSTSQQDYSREGTNNATVYGATYVSGFVGGAFSFDGVDDYVKTGLTIDPSTTSITVEVWVYPTVLPSEAGTMVVVQQMDGTGTGRAWIYAEDDTGTWHSMAGGSRKDSGIAVKKNEWQHLAFVWNKEKGTWTWYVNGVKTNDGTMTVESADGNWLVGAHKSLSSYWFNGTIDEVKIYNRALTADEIKQHYYRGKGILQNNGTCFTITADNVVFDCAGYSIVGNTSGAGIYVNNSNNVTIFNCEIANFTEGIHTNVQGDVILDELNFSFNNLHDNTYGMYLYCAGGDNYIQDSHFEYNTFSNNDYGLWAKSDTYRGFRRNYIQHNTFSDISTNSITFPRYGYKNYIYYNKFENVYNGVAEGTGAAYNEIKFNNFTNISNVGHNLYGDNQLIENNKFVNATKAIAGRYCQKSRIYNNNITQSQYGVYLTYYSSKYWPKYVEVINNTISADTAIYYYTIYNQQYNNTIFNNTLTITASDGYGIYSYHASNNNVTGNTISGGKIGVYLVDGANNWTIERNKFYDFVDYGAGIQIEKSNYTSINHNIFNNSIAVSNKTVGIKVRAGSYYTTGYNNTFWNSRLWFEGAKYSEFERVFVQKGNVYHSLAFTNYGDNQPIDNYVKDSVIANPSVSWSYAVYSNTTEHVNNYLVNVTFDRDSFTVGGNATIWVGWWVDVYVNNTQGKSISNANVTAYNVYDAVAFTGNTDGGKITTPLYELKQNSTGSTSFNPYNITAHKLSVGYGLNYTIENITTNKEVTILLADIQEPNLTLYKPDYTVTNNTTVLFNFTVTDNVDTNLSCDIIIRDLLSSNLSVYSLYCVNASYCTKTITLNESKYNYTVQCSDDDANKASVSSNLTVDISPPNITINYPQSTTYSTSVNLINVSVDDLSLNESSVYAVINNVTYTLIKINNYFINDTLSLNDGSYTLTVYASDNVGHSSNKTISFTVSITQVSAGGGETECINFDLSLPSVACEQQTFEVTASRESGIANVAITFVNGLTRKTIYTDASGTASIALSYGKWTVKASKQGYCSIQKQIDIVHCNIPLGLKCEYDMQCVSGLCLQGTTKKFCAECITDNDCKQNEYCNQYHYCINVECKCGVIKQHKCIAYECCSNADCEQGMHCYNHKCIAGEGLRIMLPDVIVEGKNITISLMYNNSYVDGIINVDGVNYSTADGRINIMLAAGKHVIKAYVAGLDVEQVNVNAKPKPNVEVPETVNVGQLITIKVRDSSGNPIRNQELIIQLPSGEVVRTKTDENGIAYVLSYAPGKIKVELVGYGITTETAVVNKLQQIIVILISLIILMTIIYAIITKIIANRNLNYGRSTIVSSYHQKF